MSQETIVIKKSTSVAPFFSYLMEQDEKTCQQNHFVNGEYIFQEGIKDDRVYLIQEGEVEVGYPSTKSQWVDMGPYGLIDMEEDSTSSTQSHWRNKTVLGAGECLGEPCCLHDTRHHLSARAMGNVQMLSVHGHSLKALCSNNSDLVQCVADILAQTKNKLRDART